MEQAKSGLFSWGWRLIGAAIAPFVTVSAYLFFTRWPSYRFTTFSDYAGLSVSVVIGAIFVALLPIRLLPRIVSLLVYVPVLAGLLFFYTFWFIAVFFHDGP